MMLISGKPLSYKQFCNIHEEVLEWLLDVEDKMASMPKIGRDQDHKLGNIRDLYAENRAFLDEVEEQDAVIGEVSYSSL